MWLGTISRHAPDAARRGGRRRGTAPAAFPTPSSESRRRPAGTVALARAPAWRGRRGTRLADRTVHRVALPPRQPHLSHPARPPWPPPPTRPPRPPPPTLQHPPPQPPPPH